MGKIDRLLLGCIVLTMFGIGYSITKNMQIKDRIIDRALIVMDANKDGVTSIKEQKGNMPNALYTSRRDSPANLTVKTTTRDNGHQVEYRGTSPPLFDVRDCQRYLEAGRFK